MGWIDILPLTLIVILLASLKPVKETNTVNEGYLSLETGNSLRGFFALVVVLHHLSQRTEAGWLFQFFEHMGHVPVAAFFFLSGYGLQKSHIASANYKEKFLQRRLPKILLPYGVVTFLYWLVNAMQGNAYTLLEVVGAILRGSPIAEFSWYILCICCFYVAFWLFMRVCKDDYNRMVRYACIWHGVYFAMCLLLGYGSWWYLTPHLLIFGMLWAIHEESLIRWITTRYRAVTLVTAGSFLVTFIVKLFVGGVISYILIAIFSVLFVALMLLLTLKVRIKSRILGFLGKISLDVYLIHGLFILGLRWEKLYISDDALWSLAVIAGSIAAGLVFHEAMALVQKVVKVKNQ